MRLKFLVFLVFIVFLATSVAFAQSLPESPSAKTGMTADRLTQVVMEIDANAQVIRNTIELTIDDIPLLIVLSESADRMRAMVPIRSADGLSTQELERVLQANFDSALDARYAIAQGKLWSVFIHPLSPLERNQFLSGLAQTITVARTYGQSYSGGATFFGNGDSSGIYDELLKELLKQGHEL